MQESYTGRQYYLLAINKMNKTKFKQMAYTGAVAVTVAASLVLASAQAKNDDQGDKQFKSSEIVGSTIEVHVTDKGKVNVMGAKVTAVSGDTISASTEWGPAVINWTVVTDNNTQFVRRFGEDSGTTEIS